MTEYEWYIKAKENIENPRSTKFWTFDKQINSPCTGIHQLIDSSRRCNGCPFF